MNIFILDENIQTCAQYHCDQHVVKMILESVQMLCTALNKKGFTTPYKSTHVKHPCVLWVEESFENFLWLQNLAIELNTEYRFRFAKDSDHKSMLVLNEISNYNYDNRGLTEFAQAMPHHYKVSGDAVKAYRQFYLGEKMGFAKWTKRSLPEWVDEHFKLTTST
ncbi:pyrimidine dimer DNA glycosylase/endonuclease V [Amphritea sp. 1_MG-2023]|uniref:pyrimidine dimer DNA glycosylase/endonuclease V n=1 Tax=Amphritea sp. 1_MG-2023 TaxID=3062670 RepID=UPI0026E2762A|nr:pyrimidine dimer DNA glycosylase/endonuclease V [Amphritea sp. 1_MG-2023]MDO6561974.1 pyrimidine dimer DNA glycosylase/endonuclease V [Amphritea sp. 1_MG-2023]